MNEQSVLPLVMGERGTFESFVTGPNRELVDRLKSPWTGFECLWLYGERGTGKTHLLQAVCHERPRPRTSGPPRWTPSYRPTAVSTW